MSRRHRLSRLIPAIAVALTIYALSSRAQACDSPTCCCQRPGAVTSARSGPWYIANSPNFQVCSLTSDGEARRVALQCECLRSQLTATWNDAATQWALRCQVVLHTQVTSYIRDVGAGAASTLGSSLVTPREGPVRARRIDLRTDVSDVLTAALPHELCHVVIADCFRDAPAPLWFDEGVAMLYDPPAKRALHERDLVAGLESPAAATLRDLLARTEYPAAEHWGGYYAQSGSLVRLLLETGSPRQLLDFARRSKEIGPDAALRECYHIADAAELQTRWNRQRIALSADLPVEIALPRAPETLIAADR